MLCPCGSKKKFSLCCLPLIKHEETASSPEKLMRSRYSAYATKNSKYIYDTYAKSSQSAQSLTEIESWAT